MEANIDLQMMKSVSSEITGSARITFFAQGVCLSGQAVRPGALFVSLEQDEEKAEKQLLEAAERGASGAVWLENMKIPSSLNSEFPIFFVEDVEEALKKLALTYLDELDPSIVVLTGCSGSSYTTALTAFVLEENFKVAKAPKKMTNLIEYSSFILNVDRDATLLIIEYGIEEAADLMKFVKPQFTVVTDTTPDQSKKSMLEEDILKLIAKMEKEMPVTADLLFDGDNERLRSYEWSVDATGCGYSDDNIFQIKKAEKEKEQIRFLVEGIYEPFAIRETEEEKVKLALLSIALSIKFALEADIIAKKLIEFES